MKSLWLAAAFIASSCNGSLAMAPHEPAPHEPSVLGFGLSVLDMESALAFFRTFDIVVSSDRQRAGAEFDLQVGWQGARAREVRFSLGEQEVVLTQYYAPSGHLVTTERANDLGFQHLAIVVRDMDFGVRRLVAAHAEPVSAMPQRLPQSNKVAAGIRAFYFRNPEAQFLELLSFPPDKGDAAWHAEAGPQFLGIDHSAVVTRDTERSLRFYRDQLGMKVRSESLNAGAEQEALSGVPRARVRVTSLRGQDGPGLELLEYLAPEDGAPFPRATVADTSHIELMLGVACVPCVMRRLGRTGAESESVWLADPDGHAVRLVQSPANSPAGPRR